MKKHHLPLSKLAQTSRLNFTRRLAGFTCALLLCVTAHSQQPLTPPPALKLGLIGPMTGGSADFGETMRNGVELALEEINAVGGYLGRRIEVVIKDDKADSATGKKMSEELVGRDKVFATIGFCNTGVAIASIPVFQAAKSPLLVPCAAGSPVTKLVPPAESYVFRVSPSEGIKAPYLVDQILERGWNKVAIFADETAYGQSGRADVERALLAKGIKPVYTTKFPLGVKSLTTEMGQAKAAGANVIVAYTVGPENAVIAKSRTAAKWQAPITGPWTLSFPNFLQAAGADAEGALMVQTFIAQPTNERRSAFLSAYRRKFGARLPVPMAGAQAYDATYLLVFALFGIKNGNLDGPTIKASLENQQRVFYGVVSTYDKPFTAQSKDAVTANMLVMGQVKGGVVVFANPEDAKRSFFVQRKQ
ncbi:MAG: ABC transporter substrate-binding protein [Ramlibacter sp.]|nr:ABC transporter substrate-binding protein [Ramlibacter sp.]